MVVNYSRVNQENTANSSSRGQGKWRQDISWAVTGHADILVGDIFPPCQDNELHVSQTTRR